MLLGGFGVAVLSCKTGGGTLIWRIRARLSWEIDDADHLSFQKDVN